MLAVERDGPVNLGEYATFTARVRLEFEDPDMVGQSEYRAIYDVCEGFFDHEPNHLPASLREFIMIAQSMLERIGEPPDDEVATDWIRARMGLARTQRRQEPRDGGGGACHGSTAQLTWRFVALRSCKTRTTTIPGDAPGRPLTCHRYSRKNHDSTNIERRPRYLTLPNRTGRAGCIHPPCQRHPHRTAPLPIARGKPRGRLLLRIDRHAQPTGAESASMSYRL